MHADGGCAVKSSETFESVYPVDIIKCRNIKERDGIPNLLQGSVFDVHVFHVASYDFQVISGTEPFFVPGMTGVDHVLYAWRTQFHTSMSAQRFDGVPASAEEYQKYFFFA